MIGTIIGGITGIAGKVADTVKHRNELKGKAKELKFKAQEMQHNYLKEKVTVGLFTFIAITVILPYFFWVLSPFLKYIPFMTDILTDYEVILNTIKLDRIFKVVFTLLGIGGASMGGAMIGRVKMAAKKADKDAEVEKEKIKLGIVGDDFVNIETDSKLKKVKKFVEDFGDIAEDIEKKYKLPASGILAHAALESGWGEKILRGYRIPDGRKIKTNNIFNIKKSSDWAGTVAMRKVWEVEDGENINIEQSFKVYRNIEESFNDYAKLLTTKDRYKKVTETKNAEEYGKALYECGYMTDDKAPEKIKKIADKYFNYET